MARNDLQGTLDLLVSRHWHRPVRCTGTVSSFTFSEFRKICSALRKALYPALHRMEQEGWISAEWALTETNRKAKYYKPTPAGRRQLQDEEKSFEQLVRGVRAIQRYA